MATRIRTLNFLPEIFKTSTNAQFLRATLDQIVDQPNTKVIQGFVGSKFGYGVNPKDYYVTEPTKVRTDYQLEPGVVFTKPNESLAQDFISYPGILDSLALEGGITDNNNRLFNSQFYSWDSFTNLDKIINYNQYYWIPNGPQSVIVSNNTVFNNEEYLVTSLPNAYRITDNPSSPGSLNPTLTLLRGGTYEFVVDQTTQFWIQGVPGVTGLSPIQTNLSTRDILGVDNNGITEGTITFNVPFKNAQNEYNLPGANTVDLVTTLPYSQVNGAKVSDLGGIDGVTSLSGLTLLFYNTGVDDGTNNNYYVINLVGLVEDPTILLTLGDPIPSQEKITASYGTQWIGRNFFKNIVGSIEIIPYISATLDTLYYQDGSTQGKVGVIKLIDSNLTNTINVDENILGKKNFTATNGVVFTNGLKVTFQGDVIPESYLSGEYYVEGVGSAIELIPVGDLIAPESFTQIEYLPFDISPYDIGNYDANLYIPKTPDYITIARNAINRNAWSRSNRWFHIDVINATAEYNNDPTLISVYANKQNKAARPIIEFYPNLKLFESGTLGKAPIDFMDFRTTDAFEQVSGKVVYYPDITAWTTFPGTAIITTIIGDNVTGGVATTIVNNRIFCASTAEFNIGDEVVFTNMQISGTPVSTFGTLESGTTYYISEVVDGTSFIISATRFGSVYGQYEIAPGVGTSMTVTVTPLSTTITVPTADITYTPAAGQYIADSTLQLPTNSQIISVSGLNTDTTTILVGWDAFTTIAGTISACLSMSTSNLENFMLFDGARIVFAADENNKNKIFVSQISKLTPSSTPVITLFEASDGEILDKNQVVAYRGFYNAGKDFYYEDTTWRLAQQKISVNQPPLFDIFDKAGTSFGNKTIYSGSSFKGCKLFAYGIGSGIDDTVLNFPLRYSSIDNIGDISFDVSLNQDTFDYVFNNNPITEQVNTGYVYNYISRDVFQRELGWQTAVSPSVQYQLFEFTFDPTTQSPNFVLDVPPVDSSYTNWPIIQVYANNNLLTSDQYNVLITANETAISILSGLDPLVSTIVQILIISDKVSEKAYYTVPINLTNNPFNTDPTTVNVGDIRGQYQSIFYNNPNTTGEVFGSNNYRDLGNIVPYGNRIIQNSASLVLPGAFLRKQNHNFFNSVEYNSRSYLNFKTLLIDVINKTEYSVYQSPASILDDALDQITSAKTDTAPFFWSDMLPSKAPYVSNTYSFNVNSLTTSVYPLSQVYDFSKANYDGVLVYLVRMVDGLSQYTQLIRNTDYVVSEFAPSLTVNVPLAVGDTIIINEYNQTYGSYIPNTPTKLGLYPATIPSVILDIYYINPTYFIRGHDGSYNKLYGSYNPVTGRLVDFRDQALLEFEKRIYNNLKLSAAIPVQETDVIPGFWRETDYTNNEILRIYSELFLNWVGQNRIDYQSQSYDANNQFSYNYWQSGNKINRQSIEQGNWRGIYQYYFDTTNVSSQPWEMIGYTNKPTWWEDRYGPAPYTSDNLVLWNDLAQGIDYNDGSPIVKEQYIRPELLEVLPVDSQGSLVSPFNAIVGNYTGKLFKRNWKVGDSGPAEFAYRRSPTWPFDLMKILALTKPAEFFNLGVDLDNYKYSEEFNQYLVNDRRHLIISDIEIYGSGIPKTSYINWIVDYEKQLGINATTNIQSLLNNLDVRLVYRLAGFSDKDLLKFFVEKSVPSSRNASLLIPDESYAVLLYDNQPFDRIIYSGVVIQLVDNGFAVYGNSQTKAYFTILKPENNGKNDTIEIESLTVKTPVDYTNTKVFVPYGTVFTTLQEVAVFLTGYGAYLSEQGMFFGIIENGIEVTWRQMVAELLYWAQLGWEIGSIATLNPAATSLAINKDSYIVQPLTITNQNFVLNQNLYPIQSKDLSVVREDTAFTVQPLNQGDTIGYGQFNISNFEHGIVFDNVTLFNDTIYNLTTGLKQNRIYVRGTKTADWDGTIDASGFILNQDNILEWNAAVKYTTGSIVKYKNKYWIAITIVQPKELFQETEWKQTDYNEVQKGLLPNSSTRSFESTLYYDVNKANLESDADLLSFSLIGFRPRDYMSIADLTDITQVNLYQNIIKNKGTRNAVNAFKGATLPQGGIDYDVYENWAIKAAEFGGTLGSNFIEMRLRESLLTGNPAIVALNNGAATQGAQQEIPLYSLFNYDRPVSTNEVLPTLPNNTPNRTFMDAGYVNLNDVKLSSYYYSGLPTATNRNGVVVPLSDLYVRDYVWLANYLSSWQILTPASLGQVIFAKNNLNGTTTITFYQPHNLSQYDIFAIVNFNPQVNGYYVVALIVDPHKVIINLSLDPSIRDVVGQGIGFKFQSQRVQQPSDIANLPLLSAEFSSNKVWVDEGTDGSWAVYEKTINYKPTTQLTNTSASYYGSAVAYTTKAGYLVGDSGLGKVYRYVYNSLTDTYDVKQELSNGSSFGSAIAYQNDLFAISQPTGSPRVHLYDFIVINNLGIVVNSLVPKQILTAQGGSTNWGSSVAISGDQKWIYVSATDLAEVYVYRLSETTGDYELATDDGTTPITLSIPGLTSADNFGYSISTDYYGETIVVGTPNVDYDITIDNWGKTYVFNRIVQNFIVQSTTPLFGSQTFTLPYQPSSSGGVSVISTSSTTDELTTVASGTSSLQVDMPVIFANPLTNSNVSPNIIYYVESITSSTTFTISLTKGGSVVQLDDASGLDMYVWPQVTPLYVSVNGSLLNDNEYAYIGNSIVIIKMMVPGDLLSISGQTFSLVQTLTTGNTPRIGTQFGYSVDTNTFANEILVGAPYDLGGANQEGTVYRFTNIGEKYSSVIGLTPCVVTTNRTLFINGFAVTITPGSASTTAAIITNANIPNVMAVAYPDNTLTIQLIDSSLGTAGSKLSLSVTEEITLTELGLQLYIKTQEIKCPHNIGPTQFGKAVAFSDRGSFIAAAPAGTRFTATTFDFSDDGVLDNDTLFDNNTTQFIDQFANAGAVYMFDYLANYAESAINVGKFAYAQSVNDDTLVYGLQPMYGTALSFNENVVMVGTPAFLPSTTNGKVNVFTNLTNKADWSVLRQSSTIVDIDKVENIQLFSAETNNTLDNLDYIDPLQGKLLGVVRENLDFITTTDPAGYNVIDNTVNNNTTIFWGASQVGKLWLDTSNIRFLNYHQNNNIYNSEVWGNVFPGSDVAVYSWIVSNVQPVQYQGPGTPFDITQYSVQYIITSSGDLAPVYYFWVRNTNVIFTKEGKTLSDTILQSYITNPKNSGISYFAPLLPNLYALYNSGSSINANDSVLHIGFTTGNNDDIAHSQYDLIRANFADDFLPGLPGLTVSYPQGLYDRFLDSMSGIDEGGQIVPDPFLPKAVQTGIQVRPRQSFFLYRFGALKNYFQYMNEVLAQFPISEIRNPAGTFLNKVGPLNPSTTPEVPFYNTRDYWEYINWWAPGYDNNTKSAIQVPLYANLSTLNVPPNTIVRVGQNNNGFSETYIYEVDQNNNGTWIRIGLANGTIRFNSSLWDYAETSTGFGDNFFDTVPFDQYPSEETRYILRALNEQILIDELLIYRNRGLITIFEYVQNESLESQNYLPWLNKTSFIDVFHTLRQLKPYQVFQSDNQDFLAGYINEVKPYHVVIKEFVYKYTGEALYAGDITDFDLPAKYNSNYDQFITPSLVYSNPSQNNEYLPTDPIWQEPEYSQWFNNRGLSIIGQDNYPITVLRSYVPLNATAILVDNASGFPINGVITIGQEKISYAAVDRNLNLLTGLFRGVDNTNIEIHIPGEQIIIDLPAVLVLDGGRNYSEPPKVSAYIDTTIYPAPFEPAQLQAVMSGDSVLQIDVINPGRGYAVLPQIVIESSVQSTFNSTQVNVVLNTIQIFAPDLITGDLIQYKVAPGTEPIGGLQVNQWYYVNVLETTPTYIIGLYSEYSKAIKDQDRIEFYDQGSGDGHSLNLGAKASCVTSASPIRENNITLRFDRTTYNSDIIDWEAGRFYSSFFAGSYYTSVLSSSSLQLQNTQPPIASILASRGGIPFEIAQIENDQVLTWSSLTRNITATSSVDDSITLAPYANLTETNTSQSTIGFYVGMPIYFNGSTGTTNLENNKIYYVWSIIDETKFTISSTIGDITPSPMVDGVVGGGGLLGYTGSTDNTATLTINYPGILTVTNTQPMTNYLTVPLNAVGSGGTNDFYIGAPIFFTGTMIGGVVENLPYYVTTVVDNQRFTMSTEKTPVYVNLSSVSQSTNVVTIDSTVGFSTNDPVIVNDMTFDVGYLTVGEEYVITTLSNTDWNAITGNVSATYSAGSVIVPIIPGEIVTAGSFFESYSYRIYSLGDTDWNAIGYVGTPIVGGTFVATGIGSGTGTAINGLGKVSSTVFYPSFGGIVSGTTYYISSVTSANSVILSTAVNGPILNITTDVFGSATITNQKNAVQLTTGTGTGMILNFALPVSPGQINGQKFTFYNVSDEFVNLSGNVSNLLNKEIAVSIGNSVNRIALSDYNNGLDNIYINLPVTVTSNYHGLTAGSTYFVNEKGRIQTIVSQTISSTNRLVCDTVDSLYVDMPIQFSQESLGLLELNYQYYVKEIFVGTNEITISSTPGGSVVSVQDQSAAVGMIGTGSPYVGLAISLTNSQMPCVFSTGSPTIVTVTGGTFNNLTPIKFSNIVSTEVLPNITYYVRTITPTTFNISLTPDSALVNVTTLITGDPIVTDITNIDLEQDIQTLVNFDVSYILGGYSIIISNPGVGYAVTNTITVNGSDLGGLTPNNNMTITVNTVNATGGILEYDVSGSPTGDSAQYYLKVISANQLKVYSNPELTAPVSGINFPFRGTISTTVTGTDSSSNILVNDVSEFNLYDPIVFTGYLGAAFAGLEAGKVYYISNINVPSNYVQISSDPGPGSPTVVPTPNLSGLNYLMSKQGDYALLTEPFIFNESIVTYNNRVWVCVVSNNDNEFILGKWQQLNSDDRRLNAMDRVKGYYQPTINMPGKDLSQLVTGVEYPGPQYFGNAFAPDDQYPLDTILQDLPFSSSETTTYDVVGDAFTSGYGPEELVPGIISDSVTMTVATRPGTNWPVTEYENAGYFTKSIELSPTSAGQTLYSFYDLAQTPQSIRISVIDRATGLSTTLVGPNSDNITQDYSVDWINETITIVSPITYFSANDCDKLRIDVYETGNGDQLVRASTNTDPIRYNEQSGWNEIFVNCNYSEQIYIGSGLIRPNTEAIETEVISTDAMTNAIYCADVSKLVLNDQITFQGNVFGNIQENTSYYVKTISNVTDSITISDQLISGIIAGPTYELTAGPTSGQGPMYLIAEPGQEQVWTPPVIFWNGKKLNFGVSRLCSKTNGTTNTITCNSTFGLVIGQPIVFDDNAFGGIEPQTIYYVKTIAINAIEFTLSPTSDLSSTLPLTSAFGSTYFITNDYTIGRQPNQFSAKLVLPGKPDPLDSTKLIPYEQSIDFINYALFGETVPQYGGTIPETQYFELDGSTTFNLTNYVLGTNADNAIVEKDGIRLTNVQDYTINPSTGIITLTDSSGSLLSVTTYQFTERQYFNTQYFNDNLPTDPKTVAPIINVTTELEPFAAEINCFSTSGATDRILCSTTVGLLVNMMIQFKSVDGSTIGNIETDGTVYHVQAIFSGTNEFTISDTLGGPVKDLTNSATPMVAFAGGVPSTRIATEIPHNLVTNDLVRIDGTQGSTQLNNQLFYVHKIDDVIVDLYEYNPANPAINYNPILDATNYPVTGVSTYLGGGYVWKNNSFVIATTIASSSSSLTDSITCDSTEGLVEGTPVIFVEQGVAVGSATVGGLLVGTTYYIKEILLATSFTVSAVRDGDNVALSDTSGLNVQVSQWEQANVDRLWVTINGYRVPSSSLRLNTDNELSILATVDPDNADTVIITSMIPTATPNEQVYLLNVNNMGTGVVNRANTMTRTWITAPLYNTSTTITVSDATRITDTIIQTVTVGTPAVATDYVMIGLNGDKDILTQIIVYNNTTSQIIDPQYYSLVIEATAPQIKLIVSAGSGVTIGDSLIITEVQGNLIYLNGEYIRFNTIDLATGVLSGLTRGLNGTGMQIFTDKYSEVYGILSTNRMTTINYNATWNSNVYNQELGDPLQISNTSAANFLNRDIT
jgi:hypothetical protein